MSATPSGKRCKVACPLLAVLAVAGLLALAGCNGDDIGALPEAIAPPGGGVTVPPPGSVVLDAVDRGFWRQFGTQDPNDMRTVAEGALGGSDWNAYFVFDLAGITGPFSSVELRLEFVIYSYPIDPTETFSVWDVTTPISTLTAAGTDDGSPGGFHQDLQTGLQYGTFTVSPGDVGTVRGIPLNGAALTDVTAALGSMFAVGVSVDTVGTSNTEGGQFSTGNEARTHQLVLIP